MPPKLKPNPGPEPATEVEPRHVEAPATSPGATTTGACLRSRKDTALLLEDAAREEERDVARALADERELE